MKVNLPLNRIFVPLSALLLAWVCGATAFAQESTLGAEVEALKEELLDLNRDLFILEEDLLAPSDTQVALFVSLDIGRFFSLDSVQIRIDDKEVANYLYTAREVDALARGGVHRIFLGNLGSGDHELVAYFTGRGPRNRDFQRGQSFKFEKQLGPKYIELKIVDDTGKQQPVFQIRDWE